MRLVMVMARTIKGMGHGLMMTLLAGLLFFASVPSAYAQDPAVNARYAAIVVDAQSGEVLYARRADAQRYPASLTKIMTLYMAFEAISTGQLDPNDTITISYNASSQPPTKIGLRPGDTITVHDAMVLVALYSANDLAVALAEKIGGTEERFAALMTIRAHDLGMKDTNFANPSGLPDARQLTTAQDMAILARATLRDYPQYFSYFNVKTYTFRGRTYMNHNPLLGVDGVDGMKTGYTNAAGYNLVATKASGDHRIITVMLGSTSKSQRRQHVSYLMNTGFDVMERRAKGEVITVAQNVFMSGMQPQTPPSMPLPDQAVPYTQYASLSTKAEDEDQDLKDALAQRGTHAADAVTLSSQTKAPAVVEALVKTPKPNPIGVIKPESDVKKVAPKAEPKPDAKAKTASASETEKTPTDKSKKQAAESKKKKKDPNAVWGIQVGAFKDKSLASDWVKDVRKRFKSNIGDSPADVSKNEHGWYRTRFNDMTKDEAQKACKAIEAKRIDCMVIKPDA